MKALFAITFASVYGLILRGVFGMFAGSMEVMGLAFLCLSPLVIGFLTVFFWPEEKVKTKGKAFGLPWLTSIVILMITMLFDIEGAICWIMIFPIFGIAAGLGGMMAHYMRTREVTREELADVLDDNDWSKTSNMKVSVLMILPMLIGVVEGDKMSFSQYSILQESITIEASPEEVWNTITTLNIVNHAEKSTHFTDAMGFPKHLRTTLDTCAVGGKRMAYYEKGLYFEETITELIPFKKLVLDIDVDPNKIPPTVLDEHIVIGGKHVDVIEDIYTLRENAEGSTVLTLSNQYVINTPFNWYAGIWAKYLMKDLLKGELNMMKVRAENQDVISKY
jgi:hypothetical protein